MNMELIFSDLCAGNLVKVVIPRPRPGEDVPGVGKVSICLLCGHFLSVLTFYHVLPSYYLPQYSDKFVGVEGLCRVCRHNWCC